MACHTEAKTWADTDWPQILVLLVREGARRMLVEALQAEVDDYIARHLDERDEHGRRLGRNGSHRPREVLTSAGAFEVTVPRVNDRRTDPDTGQRRRFAQCFGVVAITGHQLPGRPRTRGRRGHRAPGCAPGGGGPGVTGVDPGRLTAMEVLWSSRICRCVGRGQDGLLQSTWMGWVRPSSMLRAVLRVFCSAFSPRSR